MRRRQRRKRNTMILSDLHLIKENYLTAIKDKWHASSDSFPDFLSEIDKESKMQNEQYLQTFSNTFQKQLNKFSRIPIGRRKWKRRTLSMIDSFLREETIIGIRDSMNHQTLDSFKEELRDFLIQVRKFAPELSFDGIGQAMRNYVVYAMFKEINQIKSGLSMAVFGYSMLYPFTDNFIDSKNYSNEQKSEYNQIIRDKLMGKEVYPRTIHQQKTCELLQAIESDYPRAADATIFTLLLMMLEAQEDSIRQQNKKLLLTVEERLDISLYKGGISVLIDRFFVNKEITEADVFFYLGFGFFLQLADDLQDIKEDSQKLNQTIFTVDLHYGQEEKIVNKMLHFIHELMESYQAENYGFKNFILYNCYQLIYFSVIRNKEFFSKEYLDILESLLPVTYSFYTGMEKKNTETLNLKTKDKYMKILDEMIFS